MAPGAVLAQRAPPLPGFGRGERRRRERDGASVQLWLGLSRGCEEYYFPESAFLSVYSSCKEMVVNCFLYGTTHRKALTAVSGSCKGRLEREVAVSTEENLSGDIDGPLVGASKGSI